MTQELRKRSLLSEIEQKELLASSACSEEVAVEGEGSSLPRSEDMRGFGLTDQDPELTIVPDASTSRRRVS